MKKTFRTILAGALALLTVSCYDDSALRGDLEDVKGDLSELKAEFEAFKTKLNGEVSALQTSYNTLNASFTEYKGLNDQQVKTLNTALDALKSQVGVDENSGIRKSVADVLAALNEYKTEADEKITTAEAALKVLEGADSSLKKQLEDLSAQLGTKADAQTLAALVETVESITVRSIAEDDKGNIVITLANNQTLTVAKDGNGVVKVVDGEWVVSGPEGDVALGLPITQENLVFNIDWRTGELCYAVVENPTEDDWVSTGVNVGGNNVGSSYGVITDVDVWESNEYVSVRVDGEWYKLMLMADADSSSAAVLEILAGKTIVPMGGSKVVDLNAVGITDIYVMSKPDGWKAIINGNKLTVTGPVEGNPYAESEGLVLLHGTTETGQCIVAKLAVTTSTAGLEIIVDDAAATVTIKNGLVVDSSQMSGGIGGMPVNLEGEADNTEVNDLVFDSFMFGWMLPEDLARAGSIENYIMQNNIYPIDQIAAELKVERGVYSADNPIETLTFKIADLWALFGMEWQEGTHTICYATPKDGRLPDLSGLVYDYYNPVVISFTEIEATHSDISLSVTRNGASSYIIGMGTTEVSYGRTYMEQLESRFESWVNAKGMSPFGVEAGNVQNEEVKLSKYATEGEVSLLRPSTEYYVYAFPVIEGKPYDEYVFATDFLPYVKTFKTADLVEGASVNVTIAKDEDATTYTGIVATLSAVGAEMVFYKWYDSESSVDEFETNAELVKDVSSTGYMALANMDVVVRSKSLKAGESQYLVAVGADKDGKYGAVSEMSLSTKAYPYDDENITVAVKDVTFNSETGKPTVTYTVTGATHLAVYSTSSYNGKAGLFYSGTNIAFVGNVLGTSKNYYNTILEVVDGEVAVEYANYNSSNKYSFASGVNLMNNKVTALSTPLVTDIATYESTK